MTTTKQQARTNAVNLLTEAKLLMQQGWTKNRDAVDNSGKRCNANSKRAIRFCARGAIKRAKKNLKLKSTKVVKVAVEALTKALPKEQVNYIVFNDTQKSKKPVIALFQRAIDSLNAF